MRENMSQKRVFIDHANRRIFTVITISAAILVFALMSLRSLYGLSRHRAEVIDQKNLAADTLKKNDQAVGELISSFKAFESTPESVLGTAEPNSKIVLDSLPPEYDFPALATSLEKILTDGGYTINEISGVDNEVNESDDDTSSPQPIEMTFTIAASGTLDKIKNLPFDLERSIRPIHILSVELSGTAPEAKMVIEAKTYYQPAKNLDIRYKEVK